MVVNSLRHHVTASSMSFRRRSSSSSSSIALAAALLVGLAAWAIWSYRSGGLIAVLLADVPAGGSRLAALRQYILAWGLLAPVVYFLAVIVEVLVAPIPGTLLYAPSGAIFGGLMGGALSLMGNVTGAGIACWLGRTLGEAWVARRAAASSLARHRERLLSRGAWVIFLLRLNPLTSSDLVSYVAGAMGVPVRRVVLGTLAGMAPACFLQAYLAASLFEFLPGGPLIVLALGAAYLVVVVWLVLRR
jgi:uncharacterized membrane protein YdjX (TVP38/TMEM64 family)